MSSTSSERIICIALKMHAIFWLCSSLRFSLCFMSLWYRQHFSHSIFTSIRTSLSYCNYYNKPHKSASIDIDMCVSPLVL